LCALCVTSSFGCDALVDLDSLRVRDAAVDSISDTRDANANLWIDDFNRPDDNAIGNGWLMKTPAAFHLKNHSAYRLSTNGSTDYRDNIVFRPAAEDLRDVTVTIEFKEIATPPGYPQVEARIQQSSVSNPNTLDCYIFFIADAPSTAIIGRQKGSSYLTTLASMTLTMPVDITHRFRLILSVSGTTSVTVSGEVDMLDPNQNWIPLAQKTVSDTDTTRIEPAGSVGFSAGTPEVDGQYSYFNFTRLAL